MALYDDQIKELVKIGLNQYEIANRLGINQSTVSKAYARLDLRRKPGICFQGHSLEGRKQCRICERERTRDWKERKRRKAGIPKRGEKPFCKNGHARIPENVRQGRSDCLICHREHARKWGNDRRARKKKQFIESIDPNVVWDRDNGMCGICGTGVDKESWHMDHKIPLSRGGEHSYANVQVSHPICNLRKGDS